MTHLYLTDEQRHLLEEETKKGQPIDVVDPQTMKTYVILEREQYERIRTLLNETAAQKNVHERVEKVPLPVKLRDLPTSHEIAAETARSWKKLGFARRQYRQDIEDQLKLQYYFGGSYVGYLPTKEGPVIVAAGRIDSEGFARQLEAVEPERRRDVILDVPSRWNETVSQILTPNL